MHRLAVFAFALVLSACASASAASPGQPQPTLPQSPLVIDTSAGPHRFTVELASTPAQQERGLMFRTRVPPDQGMLFDFGSDGERVFWMKNTLVPLDMVFIRSDGVIVSIAQNTVPLSEDRIYSNAPASAVLELAGGRTTQLGIRTGQRVHNAIFGDPPS